jgi:hypothetical protein
MKRALLVAEGIAISGSRIRGWQARRIAECQPKAARKKARR